MQNWFSEMTHKFSAGISHCFILHGNTGDYMPVDVDKNNQTVRDYRHLEGTLARLFRKRDAVIFYNRSAGWRFRNDQERDMITGLLTGQTATATNPLAAGINKAAGPFPLQPAAAIQAFEKILKNSQGVKVAIVIEYAESIFASKGWTGADADVLPVSLLRWAADRDLSDQAIILICADEISSIHPSLRSPESKIEPILITMPDYQERLEFIGWYLSRREVDINGTTPEQLATVTSGLSLLMIEDILLRAEQEKRFNRTFVKERKDDIIRGEYADVVEIIEPRFGWDGVGGMGYLRKIIETELIAPLIAGDNECPMGVLMSGPPGVGKSTIAEVIAFECGVQFLVYRPGNILSKWVGDSEAKQRKFFRLAEDMAPCVVFIDELDKTGIKGNFSSDVSERLLQGLQEFMSDTRHRGKIVMLGATNYPDSIPPALKRSGRFDMKIAILAPTDNEARADVIKTAIKQRGLTLTGAVAKGAQAVDGYVHSDIQAVVSKAAKIAGKGKPIKADHIVDAAQLIIPSVDKNQIDYMTALAIKECNDLSLLPPGFKMSKEQVTNVIATESKSRHAGREL